MPGPTKTGKQKPPIPPWTPGKKPSAGVTQGGSTQPLQGYSVTVPASLVTDSRAKKSTSGEPRGEENGVYVRLGSSNRQADKEMVAELKRIAEQQSFDEMPMPKHSLEDIDLEAARAQFSVLFGKNRKKLFPEASMCSISWASGLCKESESCIETN